MAIEIWLPALLGYLMPVGLFLLAWGGMPPQRARRAVTLGSLALALALVGYFAVGFAFHLGGAGWWVPEEANLAGLRALYGYDGEKEWGLLGLTGFFLSQGVDGEPLTPQALALFVNYVPLVAVAVLLVVLSISERASGWQVVLGGLVVSVLVFPGVACWAWGRGWLTTIGQVIATTDAPQHGFVDYAGSGVVYLLGGVAALGALVGLGRRSEEDQPESPSGMPPAHFPLLANLGALLFGLGLLGWSLSVPFHVAGATLNVPRVAVNVLLSMAGAVVAVQGYCRVVTGQVDALMSARGMAAGLIAIAAGAPFVPPWAALLVGTVAGLLLPLGIYLVERVLRLPDATATVALGLTAGLVGLLAVPIFADGLWGQGWNGVGVTSYQTELGKGVTGLLPAQVFATGDGPGQLLAQLAGIGAIVLWAFITSGGVFWLLSLPARAQKE